MPDAPIRDVIGLPPAETVRAFEARDDLRATVRWSEMWHADHARAFTVAKVVKLDLLAEIQASLADMLANGGTFEQWQANLVPHLQAQGWWGKVADATLTGTDEEVTIGPRRLRTIYDTNLRVSRAAGRWARIQELKGTRPFLRYTAVLDARTRPEHQRWHGIILPVDHEWWDTHFPPCGWFCRCTVRQLSQRELDAKGWTVSPVPDDGPPRPFFRADSATPEMVPAGISPGWAYNPGMASMAAIGESAARSAAALALAHIAPDRQAIRTIAEAAALSMDSLAPGNLAAARAVASDLVASDALTVALAQKATLPVAVLDPEQRVLLDAPSPVVVLPAGTQRKQERRHAEVVAADFRKLPAVIHDPLVIIEAIPGEKLMYYAEPSGRLWKAVIRFDADRPFPAVVSFHMTDANDLEREVRKGRIVLDRRS